MRGDFQRASLPYDLTFAESTECSFRPPVPQNLKELNRPAAVKIGDEAVLQIRLAFVVVITGRAFIVKTFTAARELAQGANPFCFCVCLGFQHGEAILARVLNFVSDMLGLLVQ